MLCITELVFEVGCKHWPFVSATRGLCSRGSAGLKSYTNGNVKNENTLLEVIQAGKVSPTVWKLDFFFKKKKKKFVKDMNQADVLGRCLKEKLLGTLPGLGNALAHMASAWEEGKL